MRPADRISSSGRSRREAAAAYRGPASFIPWRLLDRSPPARLDSGPGPAGPGGRGPHRGTPPVSATAVRDRLLPEPAAAKVPEITAWFWVIKILTTCGGEAVSDYLAEGSRPVGAAVEAGLLIIALTWQFRTRRYVA